MKQGNRHPVDRLGDIRERRKELDAEEDEVRPVILEMESVEELAGDDWTATIRTFQRTAQRYDMEAIELHFGRAALERFRIDSAPRTVKQIFLKRRSGATGQRLKAVGN
jgi:hypothetical protein